MKTIDLNKIMTDKNLDKKEIAKLLFPENKHASLALSRILKGEAELDAAQINRLSNYTNIPIQDLYKKEGWKMESNSMDFIEFYKDDFKAHLNTTNWTTRVFHNGSMFHEEIIHDGFIPLSTYIGKLEEIINNKNKENEQD